ncbi:MAG: hypothetical protein LAT67_14470 [Balneolales bacterium]|nr:hypothetical protein [Balneolales bacterium]
MGGEGSMSHAIQSLRYNKSLRKRESYFKAKKDELNKAERKNPASSNLQFRKLDNAELLTIQQKAEAFENSWKWKIRISIAFSILVFSAVVWYLMPYL